MNSISVRLLLAAAVLMAIFIGVTTLVIQHTVDERAELAQQERMQGQIYTLLGVTDIGDDGEIDIHAADLPNGLMRQPASGIYAEVRDAAEQQIWHSPSLTTPVPSSTDGAIGQWMFSTESDEQLGPLFIMRFAVEWLLPAGTTAAYQFIVADSSDDFNQQRSLFNRNLWIAMLTMGLFLLLSMALVLAWGLSPIRRLSKQLNEIESGTRESLPVDAPVELHPLASSINMLVASERSRQKRYRQTLDDLAHSLKTPLSVLRNSGQDSSVSGDGVTGDKEFVRQADRMEQIISYHTKRADAGTKRLLTSPVSPVEPANRIIRSLEKVYHDRNIQFNNQIDPQALVRVEEADLMEIFGNLLENACKYGASVITLHNDAKDNQTILTIDDDGPGIPQGMHERLLTRGVRADTQVEGQGIGLSISRELIEGYGGELQLADSFSGGASVVITLPAV